MSSRKSREQKRVSGRGRSAPQEPTNVVNVSVTVGADHRPSTFPPRWVRDLLAVIFGIGP